MIRKTPVHLAVELGALAAQALVQARREHAGDAVAAVHREAEWPRELHIRGDALDVGVEHVGARALAGAGGEALLLDALAQSLHRVAVQRLAADDHLQAVVVRRVVAAAHRDAAAATEMVRGEVNDRGRRHADVDRVRARGGDAGDESIDEFRPRQAPVTADGEGRRLALHRERSERAADLAHDLGGERAADDAADIVGAEDLGRHLHAKNSIRRRGSQGVSPPVTGKPTWPPPGGNSSVTHAAAARAAATSAASGRNGSLRALSTSVGTRMRSSHGPEEAALQ